MSELNAEYVESVIKLGIIERKKAVLVSVGAAAGLGSAEDVYYWLQIYEAMDSALRDGKKLRAFAEGVVKASKS